MILITFSLLLQLGHFGFTGGQLDNLGTSSTCSDDIVYHDATIFLKLFLYHPLWLIWHLCFINLAKFRRKVQFRELILFTLGIFFLFKTKGLFKIFYDGAYSGGTKMRCGLKKNYQKMLIFGVWYDCTNILFIAIFVILLSLYFYAVQLHQYITLILALILALFLTYKRTFMTCTCIT